MKIRRATISGFTLFICGLALCGIGMWLLLSPAQYRAVTRIEIDPESRDVTGIGENVSYDPYFIQTEFEVMQSQLVLGKVIAELNLNVEWGRKYAGGRTLTTNKSIAILKRHLQLAVERGTRIVDISFTSGDPHEAANIANAIAVAYQDHRNALRATNLLNGIQALEEEYQKEEQTIKAKQDALGQLRKQLNVPSPEPAEVLSNSNFLSYFQAKAELLQMIDFHKLLQAKITAEKLNLQIPKTMLVAIVNAAQPPELPVGPNRFLGAVLLAIGLFPAVGGFLMLKSPRHPSV